MPSPAAATASMTRKARVTDDPGATPASLGYNGPLRPPRAPIGRIRDDRAPTRRRPAPTDRPAGRRRAPTGTGAHRHPALRRRAAPPGGGRRPPGRDVGPAAPARGPAQRRARPGRGAGALPG